MTPMPGPPAPPVPTYLIDVTAITYSGVPVSGVVFTLKNATKATQTVKTSNESNSNIIIDVADCGAWDNGDSLELDAVYNNQTATTPTTIDTTAYPSGRSLGTIALSAPAPATTVRKQIALGSDDCYEANDAAVTLDAVEVHVGCMGFIIYDMGLRWQSINIPQGARITEATLSLYLLSDTGTLAANIRGIDEDSPATWSSASRPSQRAKTTATITANEADWGNWVVGQWMTISVTSIVQEIINRTGWSPNNAIALVIEDAAGAGSNIINARAYEYTGNEGGAKLDITYASKTLPSYYIRIVDLDGDIHLISDHVSELETSTALSDSTDTFSFVITNEADAYSYIEKGCQIEIHTGVGSHTKKIDGYITEVEKSLEEDTLPIINVAGESGELRLNNIFFSGRFYDQEISALAKAILDASDYTTGTTYRTLADIDASNTYIEASAYSIEEATYTWKSLGEAIMDLADLVGFDWYRDTDKKLHFFDPVAAPISDTLIDADLEGTPALTDVGDIVNRAVVVGGFEQILDKSGGTQTTTTTVTDGVTKNQSFVPTEDYLSSILVYTEHVTSSASSLSISIQGDSAAAPDDVNLPNGLVLTKLDSITDAGYTEIRFKNNVTLTPGDTYWIVLKGTTSDGVKIGVTGAAIVDYKTRYPVQVAVMSNNDASQDKYGMYMQVYRDSKIEDSQVAEIKANEMLMPEPKKVVSLTLRDDALNAGDVVQLTLSTAGVTIDKTMKIMGSTQTLGEVFIYNELEMMEL